MFSSFFQLFLLLLILAAVCMFDKRTMHKIVFSNSCVYVEASLKMHSTAKIHTKGYGWHLTAYPSPSHLPEFKLCKPGMLVTPARLRVYYVNIGIHGYLEVTPKSLITTLCGSGWFS